MPVHIELSDDEVKFLNENARQQVQVSVRKFAGELLEEASRLEAAGHTGQGDPQITSSMVSDANLLLRRGYARRKKHPMLIGAQVVALVGGFLTGLFADADKLKDTGNLVTFVILLTITIATSVAVVLKD